MTAVSGRGRVYAYTVVRRPADWRFQIRIPYVYAVIQLDEGPQFVSNVVGCEPEDVGVDMPVTALFDDVTDEITLVKFTPA